MKEKLRFLGLDVHAETIAVAIAEPDGKVRSLGTIPNRAESIRKLIKKLGPAEKLEPVMRPGQRGTSCTGSWRSWASTARLSHPRWYRLRPVTE
jgi:hypothetical protein